MHGLYSYLEIIVDPNTLTTSGQCSCNFGPLCSTNNDTTTLQAVIEALCMRQIIICELYGRIENKSDV